MNAVDSSGWLEYFADGPNADFFAPAIENLSELIVPTIGIYEVIVRVLQQRNEGQAAATAQLRSNLLPRRGSSAAAHSTEWVSSTGTVVKLHLISFGSAK